VEDKLAGINLSEKSKVPSFISTYDPTYEHDIVDQPARCHGVGKTYVPHPPLEVN